jgi:molybdopterin synthase sulfur carrier subunit
MVAVKVLYFASLRERLDCGEEQVDLPGAVADVAAMLDWQRARGAAWADAFAPGRNFRVAVNHTMAGPDTRLAAGDEVAFFPPVTGG